MLCSQAVQIGSMLGGQALAATQRVMPLLSSSLARYSQVAYAAASSPAADAIPEEAGRVHSVSKQNQQAGRPPHSRHMCTTGLSGMSGSSLPLTQVPASMRHVTCRWTPCQWWTGPA